MREIAYSNQQRYGLRTVFTVGDIEIEDAGEANAMIYRGTVYLNKNQENLENANVHELSHYIVRRSPRQYAQYIEKVKNSAPKAQWDQVKARYMHEYEREYAGENLEALIEEEIACDILSGMCKLIQAEGVAKATQEFREATEAPEAPAVYESYEDGIRYHIDEKSGGGIRGPTDGGRVKGATFANIAGLKTRKKLLRRSISGKSFTAEKNAVTKYARIRYNKNGTIIVTDDWKSRGKVSIPRKYKANAVVETQTEHKNGTVQIDRSIYGADGFLKTQIHSGPHGNMKVHPYGKHGEHAHDYHWNSDGTRKARLDRNLDPLEREEHKDIL